MVKNNDYSKQQDLIFQAIEDARRREESAELSAQFDAALAEAGVTAESLLQIHKNLRKLGVDIDPTDLLRELIELSKKSREAKGL